MLVSSLSVSFLFSLLSLFFLSSCLTLIFSFCLSHSLLPSPVCVAFIYSLLVSISFSHSFPTSTVSLSFHLPVCLTFIRPLNIPFLSDSCLCPPRLFSFLTVSLSFFLSVCLTLAFPPCLSYFFTLSIFFPVCLTFISSLFISFLFTFLPTSLNFILLCLSDSKCFHPSHSHFLSLSVSLFSPSLFSFPVCLTRVSSSFSLVFLHHVYLILMSFLSISLHFYFPTISLFFSFSACLTFIFPYLSLFSSLSPPSLLSHSYFPSLSLSSSLFFSSPFHLLLCLSHFHLSLSVSVFLPLSPFLIVSLLFPVSLTVFRSLFFFCVSSPSLPVCLIPSLPPCVSSSLIFFPIPLLFSLCQFPSIFTSLFLSLPAVISPLFDCLTLIFPPSLPPSCFLPVYLPLLLAFSFFSCQSPSLTPCLSPSLPVSLSLFHPCLSGSAAHTGLIIDAFSSTTEQETQAIDWLRNRHGFLPKVLKNMPWL